MSAPASTPTSAPTSTPKSTTPPRGRWLAPSTGDAAGRAGHGVAPVLATTGGTQVAGPHHPAAPQVTPRLPTPSGPGAPTQRSYPDLSSRHSAPTWRSGTHLDEPNADSVRRAEQLATDRGRPFDVVAARLPVRTWADIARPTSALSVLSRVPGRKVLEVPVLPESGGSLTSCAKGRYHGYWRQFAQAVEANGLADAIIDLRPDTADLAAKNPAEYAACYRRVVQSLRSSQPRMQTQWSVPRGIQPGQDPLLSWPGADVVTIVGVDAVDTGNDWGRTINGRYGLNWWADFAARNGRQIALARWGLFPGSATSHTNAPYIQNMHDWLVRAQVRKQLAYEAFTAPDDFTGAGPAVYRTLFSG